MAAPVMACLCALPMVITCYRNIALPLIIIAFPLCVYRYQFEDVEETRRLFKYLKTTPLASIGPDLFLYWARFEWEQGSEVKCKSALKNGLEYANLRSNARLLDSLAQLGVGRFPSLPELVLRTQPQPQSQPQPQLQPQLQPQPQPQQTLQAQQPRHSLSRTSLDSKHDTTPPRFTGNSPQQGKSLISLLTGQDSQQQPQFVQQSPEMKNATTRLRRIGLGPPKRVTIDDSRNSGSSEDLRGSPLRRHQDEQLLQQPSMNPYSPMLTPMTQQKESLEQQQQHPHHYQQQQQQQNMTIASTEMSLTRIAPTATTGAGLAMASATQGPKDNTINNNNNKDDQDEPTMSKSKSVRVNGKQYKVLQLIGRGGSSRVFRVMDNEGELFALKKVNLKNLDEHTFEGYKNEIELLKAFANEPSIVKLFDSEVALSRSSLLMVSNAPFIFVCRLWSTARRTFASS